MSDNIKSFSIPITKKFLARHYADIFSPPLDEEYRPALISKLRKFLSGLILEHPKAASAAGLVDLITNGLNREHPHKIDENFFTCRECLEYIFTFPVQHLNDPSVNAPPGIIDTSNSTIRHEIAKIAKNLFDKIEKYQVTSRTRVEETINDMLPKDFRTTAISKMRSIKENNAKAEVDNLVASGASISEKYRLLWSQQLARRESLADIANATGLYKAIIMLVSGIPAPVLEFMRSMNHDDGPLESVRAKFGPFLYEQTQLLILISTFVTIEHLIRSNTDDHTTAEGTDNSEFSNEGSDSSVFTEQNSQASATTSETSQTESNLSHEMSECLRYFDDTCQSVILPLLKICDSEITEYIVVMTKLFANFPLLIDAHDAYKASGVHIEDVSSLFRDHKFSTTTVRARNSSNITWKFDTQTMQTNTIAFTLFCTPDISISISSTHNPADHTNTADADTSESEKEKPMAEYIVPKRKISEIFQGKIVLAPGKTIIRIDLDNTYSYFTSKIVKHAFIEVPHEVSDTKPTLDNQIEATSTSTSTIG